MLAVRAPSIVAGPEWVYEIKWDGVRTLLFWDGATVLLRSRKGRDVTATYPELSGFVSPHPVVLDGEIVALDEAGRPSFERMQGRMNIARAGPAALEIPITYVAFDLLYAEHDLTGLAWSERRERLESLVLPAPCALSHVVDDPQPLWDFVVKRGIEGVVAKRRDSPYVPGVRSSDWRKTTVVRSLRAVVGGFTAGDGGRQGEFGSLLIGLGTPEGLRWIGAVGTGFDHAALAAIRSALDEMRVDDCPFVEDPEMPRGAAWVSPQLVAVVEFKEWTRHGRLRAPSFKGFSDDPVTSVTWDTEGPAAPGQ